MNKRSKRYTDEFKMLILELLEEGRTKKSLENEYGVATATIRKWEKEFKGIIDKKYNWKMGKWYNIYLDKKGRVVLLIKYNGFAQQKNNIT